MNRKIRIKPTLFLLVGVLLMIETVLGANVSVTKKTEINLAITVAKQVLITQKNITESSIKVGVVREIQWPDSSLGCAQPDFQYMQVIIPGYIVHLFASDTEYKVHVGNGRGILCNSTLSKVKTDKRDDINQQSKQHNNQFLTAAIQKSKQHLIKKLNDPKNVIKLSHVQHSNLNKITSKCIDTDNNVISDMEGYLIKLNHEDKIYNYFYNGNDDFLCQLQ